MASKAYITHDSNARNSKKMLRMREKLGPINGPAAYGIYWMLIERLRDEENYISELDYSMLAFDFRCDTELLRSVVEDFELFDISDDGRTFWSHGLEERMALMESRSAAGRKGAAAKHNKKMEEEDSGKTSGKTDILPEAKDDFATGKTSSNNNIINKKNKIKETKENYSSSFIPSSSGDEKLTTEEKEEKEKFISFFTFTQNFKDPCYEYERMVAWNNNPQAKKKWNSFTEREKQSALVLWHPEKETVSDHAPRYGEAFLKMWKEVFNQLKDMSAPYEIRMAALSDKVKWDEKDDYVTLYIPDNLHIYIEENMDVFKPIIWPFLRSRCCSKLMYKRC